MTRLRVSGAFTMDDAERAAVRRFTSEAGTVAACTWAQLPWWAWRRKARARALVRTLGNLHRSVDDRSAGDQDSYGYVCTREHVADP